MTYTTYGCATLLGVGLPAHRIASCCTRFIIKHDSSSSRPQRGVGGETFAPLCSPRLRKERLYRVVSGYKQPQRSSVFHHDTVQYSGESEEQEAEEKTEEKSGEAARPPTRHAWVQYEQVKKLIGRRRSGIISSSVCTATRNIQRRIIHSGRDGKNSLAMSHLSLLQCHCIDLHLLQQICK